MGKKMKLTGSSVMDTFRNNKRHTVFLLAAVIGSVLFSLVPPQILRLIIDTQLVPARTDRLRLLAAVYLVSVIFSGLCDFGKGALLTDLGQRMIKNMRQEMLAKMHRLPSIYFSKTSSGSITGRFNNDVEHISSLFTDGAVSMLVDSLKMAGIVISIAVFSIKLGIAVLILIPLIYVMTRAFQKYMLKAQKENLAELGEMNEHLEDSVRNIRTVKAYSREGWIYGLYRDLLVRNFYTVRKVNFCDALYSPLIQMIKSVVIAAVVLSASGQCSIVGISVGMTAASIDLITNLFGPIEALGTEFQNIQDGISAVHRIDEFGDEEEETDKDDSLEISSIMNGHAEDEPVITAKDVSFSYDRNRTAVLDDVSFEIMPGDYVTITGRTGVGKTTLLNLVTGLFVPDSGQIKIYDTDVTTIPYSIKRGLYGYVSQDMKLIHGTLLEQITLKDPAITRERAIETMKFTGLYDELGEFADRSDCVLSQGQKQLMSIARAIAPNPPILIFDEITASLDSLTEERIVGVLKKATEQHTVLSVSHRLTSLQNSDHVIYLENGRIRARGTPEEIFAQVPDFAALLKLQESGWS
jgi:ATP-binding cassette subfamily B multidrug efflux pump